MYFERQKVDSNYLKPLSGSIGDPLKTDGNGKLIFDFYFQTGLSAAETTVEQAQEKATLLSGVKQIIVASLSDNVFPSSSDSVLSLYRTVITVEVAIPPQDQFNEVEILPTTINTSTVATS